VRDTLYRNQPPIYNCEQANRAYQKLLNTPVTVTIRDTLVLSPETCARLKDDITSKRITNNHVSDQAALIMEYTPEADPLPFATPSNDQVSVLRLGDDPCATYLCANDAVERYGKEHSDNKEVIKVGKESGALRCIWLVIAN